MDVLPLALLPTLICPRCECEWFRVVFGIERCVNCNLAFDGDYIAYENNPASYRDK